MPGNRTRLYSVMAIGLLCVGITAILFFTASSTPSPAQLAGFYSLVLTEVFVTVCLAFIELKNHHLAGVFSRAGIYTSTLFYFVVTAVLALTFMAGIFTAVKWLWAVHGVCLCLLLIVFVVIFTASKNMSRNNAGVQAGVVNLKQLENRLGVIWVQNRQAPWNGKVAKCQEEIGFFDYSCVVPSDVLLADGVGRLEKLLAPNSKRQDDRDMAVDSLLEELFALIAKRNMEAKNPLKGQF